MGKIVCVANQKGGVGKTTTAVNLAACLAAAEKKVLLIDFDPQGNASTGVGITNAEGTPTIYDVLSETIPLEEAIQKTEIKDLEAIPANINLIGAEIELVGANNREYRLHEAVKKSRNKYSYIIIDNPPSLGILTMNSLTASDSVLVPLQAEYYAMEGLSQLINTIKLVKTSFNPFLEIEGILITMFDKRTPLSSLVLQEIQEHFPQKIFKTLIPRNVRLSEAPSHGKPIILYDIRSKGADAYLDLAKEILANEKKSAWKRT